MTTEKDEKTAKASKEEESEEEEINEEKIEAAAEEPKEAKEEKPEPERKKEAEEEIVEERIYTVPFGKAWIVPRKGRTPKVIRMLKAFVKKHMKVDDDSIIIAREVNEKIWSRGIEKPPRRLRIRATKDKEGTVTVNLAEGN
jgi:large subunit ribosomal protein L31e